MVMPLWSTVDGMNVEFVETCTRYDVAPLTAFHNSVELVGVSVAPFGGDTSVGVARTVVKLHTLDQSLVPPELVAFTRQ
jgi:hypothetical protein